jgi:hypothetical protein
MTNSVWCVAWGKKEGCESETHSIDLEVQNKAQGKLACLDGSLFGFSSTINSQWSKLHRRNNLATKTFGHPNGAGQWCNIRNQPATTNIQS